MTNSYLKKMLGVKEKKKELNKSAFLVINASTAGTCSAPIKCTYILK